MLSTFRVDMVQEGAISVVDVITSKVAATILQ
jgi:hypothetical protein